MNSTTVSFHDDQAVKNDIQQRMLGHIERDEVIRSIGFANGRGCAVGCTYDTYNHADVARRSGVPVQLIHLLDYLHENTSDEIWKPKKGMPLAYRFWDAIPVGVDLQPVVHRIHAYIQERNAARTEGGIKAICERVRDLHLRAANNDMPTDDEWTAAESAAEWSADAAADWHGGRSAELDAVAIELLRLLAESDKHSEEWGV